MELSPAVSFLKSISIENANVMMARWSPDDAMIAAALTDGTISLYDFSTSSFIHSLSCKTESVPMPVTSIRWRPASSRTKARNILLATTASGGVFHWHAASGKVLNYMSFADNQVLACDYNSEGTSFALGCKNSSVLIVDESTKSVVLDLSGEGGEIPAHSNRVFSVKWINETLLVSGGWDNNLFIWDTRVGKIAKYIHGPHICGDSLDVQDEHILVGSYDIKAQLQLWNWKTGQKVHEERLSSGNRPMMPYCVQYSRRDSGKVFAVGGFGTGEVLLYDTSEIKQVVAVPSMPEVVFSIDFAYNEDAVCFGCSTGLISIFSL